jgi:molybdopterin-guanine dinucleotide biosynthesis protein A
MAADQPKLEQELAEWAASQADRDNLVRAALAAGVTKQRVHELTGIARTTINRILADA